MKFKEDVIMRIKVTFNSLYEIQWYYKGEKILDVPSSFNSLYEIQLHRLALKAFAYFINPFNSLYEIHIYIGLVENDSLATLSTLCMRFGKN